MMGAKYIVSILCCIGPLGQGLDTAEEPTCKAGADCSTSFASTSPYYWPHAHGHPSYYGNPPWPGPTNLSSSFSWRWNGPTGELYSESFNGVVIDDKKNIYVNGDKAVYKLSEHGQLLWTYRTRTAAAADGPALLDGVLYVDGSEGWVSAVDMETGLEKWAVKASGWNGGHYGHISAHNGVVVTQGDWRAIPPGFAMGGEGACGVVRGLNATNGQELWAYQPDGILWDWFPQFPDDDSVLFMDQTGMIYRVSLHTGSLMWKNGGKERTWTDGCQFLASNGLVYSVSVDPAAGCLTSPTGTPQCAGWVMALKVSDGSLVWKQRVPKPPNTAPVVGRLGKDDRLSLVMPIGQQTGGCTPPAGHLLYGNNWFQQLPSIVQQVTFGLVHTAFNKLGDEWNWLYRNTVTLDVMALDAETGNPLWSFPAETDHFAMAPGDRDGLLKRHMLGIRTVSCPTPWSSPRIGSDGTIYVGSQAGTLFAIRDANGDNFINEKEEVSTYETKGVFTHIGTAHAPGMLVAANFDSVFVFKS